MCNTNESADAAIKLVNNGSGHHVIQGNYIGFEPDGTPANGSANDYGIVVQNSADNQISYNFIGGSKLHALQFVGAATTGNHVIENGIGLAPADGSPAGNGGGSGCALCFAAPAVDIATGAHDNYIGAIGAGGGNNFIVDNFGGGVAVASDAGQGNRVYGNNVIHDNGGQLAIDLGAIGPTANDVGDADAGGNGLQNYPQLAQAIREHPGSVHVSGALLTAAPASAQAYRLDFYWTDACLASDGTGPRGELKKYVGFTNIYADGVAYASVFSALDVATSANLPTGPANTGFITAIATDAAGNTSEPGPCQPYIDDYIFANGFN